MLNFEHIAEQLEADGHFEMAEAMKAHGTLVGDLNAAVEFKDQCDKDAESNATGAARDAREWLLRVARGVCATQDAVSAE